MQVSYTVWLGRELLASMDGPWLKKIVRHIAQWKREEPGRFEPMLDSSRVLEPRIRWRATETEDELGSWVMRWRTRNADTLRMRTFPVPRHTLSGEIYSHAEALEAARQVLGHVKRCWNRLDRSDHPRFDV